MQLPWANPEKGLQNTGQNTYVPPTPPLVLSDPQLLGWERATV